MWCDFCPSTLKTVVVAELEHTNLMCVQMATNKIKKCWPIYQILSIWTSCHRNNLNFNWRTRGPKVNYFQSWETKIKWFCSWGTDRLGCCCCCCWAWGEGWREINNCLRTLTLSCNTSASSIHLFSLFPAGALYPLPYISACIIWLIRMPYCYTQHCLANLNRDYGLFGFLL